MPEFRRGEFQPDRVVGPCTCGKVRYTTKAAAKRALRKHKSRAGMHAYRCGDFWHLGHVPYGVARGVIARTDIPTKKRGTRG